MKANWLKELLDENYKLRRELDNYNVFMAKNMLNILEILKNSPESLDIEKKYKKLIFPMKSVQECG